MIELITIEDIRNAKEFSRHTSIDRKVSPAIFDAQYFDVKPLLGEQFLIDVCEKIESNPLALPNLMNEFTYTYGGRKYQHLGLKRLIALFAWYRYKKNANDTETAFGTVQKEEQYSTPSERSKTAIQINEAKSQAMTVWEGIRLYLERHRTEYPLYYCTPVQQKTGISLKKAGRSNQGNFTDDRRDRMSTVSNLPTTVYVNVYLEGTLLKAVEVPTNEVINIDLDYI